MTITIVPEPDASGKSVFRAINGTREAIGPTVGSALDALTMDQTRFSLRRSVIDFPS